ncbi:MAG: response regulator transcription factor [Alphaproteobacteria bacterium]|nr:response regulator transcription factor [Alphaproteobacteria bacterium]
MNLALIVDDHPLYRQALRQVVRSEFPQMRIAEAETLADASQVLKDNDDVALITLDMRLPDSEGFTGLMQMRSDYAHIPTVIVSTNTGDATVQQAMAFGAAGYIPKCSSREDIAAALHAVMRGEPWTPPSEDPANENENARLIASLSPAQLRILMGLCQGLRNKQIAFQMGVTENTVKAYVTAMYKRLGVSSRTEALILARQMFTEDQVV